MTLRLISFALIPLLLACDEGPGGQVGELCTKAGNVCSTPACSQFPTTPGCSAVKPNGSYCPVDLYRCWDPSTAAGYCNPATARCAKAKPPSDAGSCAPPLCTLATFMACYDTNDDLFCKNGYACQSFSCNGDGGTGDGGSSDGGAPMDISVTPDATVIDDASVSMDQTTTG